MSNPRMSYWRFAAMIATSTVVMFALMYLNTYAWDHVFWSETRAWMALLMGATMAVIMLAFMLGMYPNRAMNIGIFAGSVVVFALSLWLVRSQATISGVDYMRAMIPHHSIAVMTSERARIVDPRVRRLADEIIAAQRKEIAEMKYLVDALDDDAQPAARSTSASEAPPALVAPSEALRSADLLTTDLEEMDAAEVRKALGDGVYCRFHYSRSGGPVLATRRSDAGNAQSMAVIKLHGRLTLLDVAGGAGETHSLQVQADGIALRVAAPKYVDTSRDADQPLVDATAELQLEGGPVIGYAGFFGCGTGS